MKKNMIYNLINMLENGEMINKETLECEINKTKKQYNAKYYAQKGRVTHKQKVECPSCHKQVTKYYLKTHLKSNKCKNNTTPLCEEE